MKAKKSILQLFAVFSSTAPLPSPLNLTLVLALTFFSFAKAETHPPTAKSTEAQFFYFENYPNTDLTMVFNLKKVCGSGLNQAPFSIQEFYSELKLPAHVKDKSVKQSTVRIINMYGRYNSSCTQSSTETFEQTVQIPRSKHMTHIYLTTDTDIQVHTKH